MKQPFVLKNGAMDGAVLDRMSTTALDRTSK